MAHKSPDRRQRPFQVIMAGCIQFVVLTLLAMLLYGGGNVVNPAARGYSFFTNFFSDLGFTKTRLGTPNTASAILFFVALTLAGLTLVLFFVAMLRFFRGSSLSRVLSDLGSIFGIVAGLAFVGVAFTPANLYLGPHALFVQVAFLSFFVAVLFYLGAILATPAFPTVYAGVFACFALLLAGYLWLLFFGPRFSSASGVHIQAAGQKIIVYAAIVSCLIVANGARRLASAQSPG
jgi:hypothetical protein